MTTTKKKTMKNLIRIITITAFTVLLTNSAKAQSQISFFHLGDYVQQSIDVSPVYIPKNSFSFGLPGVSISSNLGFSPSDLLTEIPGSNKLELNYGNVKNKVEGDDINTSVITNFNILNLAFKRNHGSLSFFVNLKNNTNWGMSKNGLLNLLDDGLAKPNNTILLNDDIHTTTYVESGFGFTQQFLNDKLAVGIRVKYLLGINDGATNKDGEAQVDINNDYSWTINTNNAYAMSAGYNGEDIEHISFKNAGIGFDIGASYEIIPNLVIEAAVNDIGSITWKDNLREYYLEDVSNLEYVGTDLNSDNDVLEELEKLTEEGNLEVGEREGESYKTSLATTSYVSGSYKLSKIHQFRVTVFNNHQFTDRESVVALGYNVDLKNTTYGLVGIKNDQGKIDYGLNLATKLGPLQFYLATDNFNKIFGPLEDINQLSFRTGVNFVFGYKK